MFLAEFFVPSTLNMGIRFRNRVKGMFLSLAHFRSIKIMFAPLSNKASAEMKDFFPFGDISIFRTISLLPLMLLVILVFSGILLCLAWVRTSVDLVGSRVLPVMKVQVDVEGVSM